MCNSIMAVAHGVMLTCDLVYNRCHLEKATIPNTSFPQKLAFERDMKA